MASLSVDDGVLRSLPRKLQTLYPNESVKGSDGESAITKLMKEDNYYAAGLLVGEYGFIYDDADIQNTGLTKRELRQKYGPEKQRRIQRKKEKYSKNCIGEHGLKELTVEDEEIYQCRICKEKIPVGNIVYRCRRCDHYC